MDMLIPNPNSPLIQGAAMVDQAISLSATHASLLSAEARENLREIEQKLVAATAAMYLRLARSRGMTNSAFFLLVEEQDRAIEEIERRTTI